jgi:predicted porin
MNKKLLAIAVASAVAAPGVVAADVSVYGNVQPRISVTDSNVTMSDGGSRFGFKSSTDMGNGNTVSGNIEVAFDVSQGKAASGNTSRLGNIKFSGDWGSATIGSQWSVMTDTEWNTCVLSGASCMGLLGYQGRVADAVVIRGPAIGPLGLALQLEADGSDIAAWAASTGIDLGSISISASYRDDDSDAATQVSAGTSVAGVGLAASYSSLASGADGNSIYANLPVGSGLKLSYSETGSSSGMGANYNVDLGGATMRLIATDTDDDTTVAVQWIYGL